MCCTHNAQRMTHNKFKGQAIRQISIPKLKPLRVLHLEPINLVIFKVSDWDIFS